MFGVQVLATPNLTAVGKASGAEVTVNVTVVNTGSQPAAAQLSITVGTGNVLAATVTGTVSVIPGANTTATLSARVDGGVKLWSTTSPQLYWANVSISTPGGILDLGLCSLRGFCYTPRCHTTQTHAVLHVLS